MKKIIFSFIFSILIANLIMCSDDSSSDSSGSNTTDTEQTVKENNYVNAATGDDKTGDGTKTNPYSTITKGISMTTTPGGSVFISEGSYNETVYLQEGISLYGAYKNSDWSERNTSSYSTIIYGSSYSIRAESGITSITIIDGLTLKNGIKNSSSSPTIQNNRIEAGYYDDGYYAIINSGSSPIIKNNDIYSWGGIRNYTSSSPEIYNNRITVHKYGIYNSDSTSSPLIYNNIIEAGGLDSNLSMGIDNEGLVTKIYNNTIKVTAYSSTAIRALATGIGIHDSNPEIINNIIYTYTVGSNCDRYGIYEYSTSSDPAIVNNNDIFDCPTGLYYDENSSGITDLTTAFSTGEGTNTLSFWSNVSNDPLFDSSSATDFGLLDSSPVKSAGKDLSAYFTEDYDGNSRTAPWSIGAFEKD